jgi:hypothetical protein
MRWSLWNCHNVILCCLLYIDTFVLGQSQDLSFTGPSILSSTTYTAGQYVTVSWTTPFEKTNLLVYQLKETAYAYQVLALEFSQNKTFYVWTAGAVDGQPLTSAHPFHFVLENSDSYSCQGCVTLSKDFNVRKGNAQVSSSASSSSSSTTTAVAPENHQTKTGQSTRNSQTNGHSSTNGQATQASQTSGPGSTASAAGSTGQDQVTSSSKSTLHHDLSIGLGVGLGLGIPLLLAIIGVCFLLARRRRKQRQRFSYRPTGSGNWTVEEVGEKRESGALGPWAAPAAQSRASGLSQMSHSSWIEPFPFEKPELRDQDAISELRRSIHSSGSEYSQNGNGKKISVESPTKASSPLRETSWPLASNGGDKASTKYAWMGGTAAPTKASNGWGAGTAAARRSDVSRANTDMSSLEGIPEQLQPVHHRYGSPTGYNGYTGPNRGDGRDWPLP